jgi:hypothetical protein
LPPLLLLKSFISVPRLGGGKPPFPTGIIQLALDLSRSRRHGKQ